MSDRNSGSAGGYTPAPTDDVNGGVELNRLVGSPDSQPDSGHLTKQDMSVHYHGTASSGKRHFRTTLEKYLLSVCLLLFVACVVLVIITASRDHSHGKYIYPHLT